MSCANCPESFEICVNEGSTVDYTATLTDKAGVVIPLSSLTSLALTLKNVENGEIINNRDAVDVKNANNGTYHATSGLFTMNFQPEDAAIENETARVDRHVATFHAVVAGGDELQWDVFLKVKNVGMTS